MILDNTGELVQSTEANALGLDKIVNIATWKGHLIVAGYAGTTTRLIALNNELPATPLQASQIQEFPRQSVEALPFVKFAADQDTVCFAITSQSDPEKTGPLVVGVIDSQGNTWSNTYPDAYLSTNAPSVQKDRCAMAMDVEASAGSAQMQTQTLLFSSRGVNETLKHRGILLSASAGHSTQPIYFQGDDIVSALTIQGDEDAPVPQIVLSKHRIFSLSAR